MKFIVDRTRMSHHAFNDIHASLITRGVLLFVFSPFHRFCEASMGPSCRASLLIPRFLQDNKQGERMFTMQNFVTGLRVHMSIHKKKYLYQWKELLSFF